MSLPLITPGVAIREKAPLSLSFHLRANHVSTLAEKPKPYDLGFIETWVATHKEENRGFALTLANKQDPIISNSKMYSYKVPSPPTVPQLIGDYTNEPELGRDEQTFEIKISERICGETGIIGFGYTSGPELLVVEIPQKAPDGYVFTVKLFNNDQYEFVDPIYLAHGTKVFRKGSLRGPNSGGHYDDAAFLEGPGYREIQAHLSDGMANVSYSLDEEAALSTPPDQVVEFWKVTDGLGIAGNTLRWQDILAKFAPGAKTPAQARSMLQNAIKDGHLEISWLSLLEYQAMKKLSSDLSTYEMWGNGGLTKDFNGKEDLRLHAGIWKQFKRGPEYVYTLNTFTLTMFENEVRNYFRGKIDFASPNPDLTIVVRTGEAGFRLISNAIKKEAFNSGLHIGATDINAITNVGNPFELHYGFGFTSYTSPNLAKFNFVIDPALDPEQDSDIDNPRVFGGWRLSSYSFLIYDYNTQNGSDNIIMMKYGGPKASRQYADLVRMRCHQGTLPYGGFENLRDRVPFVSTSDDNGFSVKIDLRYPTIVVKDPTRILRFVMRNPKTGQTL